MQHKRVIIAKTITVINFIHHTGRKQNNKQTK